MKKLLLIILISIGFKSYSQNYPRVEKDSIGKTIVIMTLEQAQKIDNGFEMLSLLKRQGVECDSLNLSYVRVIDQMGKQVRLLETDVKLLKGVIVDKDNQILNLNERLKNTETINKLCEDQKNLKDDEIKLLKKDIKKHKFQKIIGFTVGILGLIGGILIII